MRRDSTYNHNIRYFFYFVFAVGYLSLSSIYPVFSPLLGVSIYYLLVHFRSDDGIYPNILIFAFLLLIDITKGYFLFSSLILLFIIYNFLAEDIKKIFQCEKCTVFGFIVASYLGYFGLNLFFTSLFNQNMILFDYYVYWYIFIDFILVVLFVEA